MAATVLVTGGAGYVGSHACKALARAVTGHAIPTELAERRAGDPPVLVCSNAAAEEAFGWSPRRGIAEQIADAWQWHRLRFGQEIKKGVKP